MIDHPGIGAAVESAALLALDELVPSGDISSWRQQFVGDSAASYSYGGKQWAVPIDAAAQVSASAGTTTFTAPRTWGEALARMEGPNVGAIPTKSPHTLLTFLGIAAALESNLHPSAHYLVCEATGIEAFGLLKRLVDATPNEHLGLDPIEILNRMQLGAIEYCPLVFGYVNYSRGPRPAVRFSNAPRWSNNRSPGSVLGGTGLAISAKTANRYAAVEHLLMVSNVLAQTSVVPSVGGQPAALASWANRDIDDAWGHFYSQTIASQIHAWRRPRHAGWIDFQTQGSIALLEALQSGVSPSAAIDRLNTLYRASLPAHLRK
ncbi:MAG: hypothetical protein HIU88_09610 [Acidobacteria bacterium]|nr:hypothetical protein [Acidobacteriota bacterium]